MHNVLNNPVLLMLKCRMNSPVVSQHMITLVPPGGASTVVCLNPKE